MLTFTLNPPEMSEKRGLPEKFIVDPQILFLSLF